MKSITNQIELAMAWISTLTVPEAIFYGFIAVIAALITLWLIRIIVGWVFTGITAIILFIIFSGKN